MPDSEQTIQPLDLLRTLRDVMAASSPVQAKLDQIVSLVAKGLHVEVCSIYLLRAGDILELFSSYGLKAEALHHARLMVGEGLVGDIAAHARPLNLAEAREHPSFVYIPETGEKKFHSLAGVPLMRNGQVIGVLVVQHKKRKEIVDAALEVLQTIAMVMTEMLSSAGLLHGEELARGSSESLLSRSLSGVGLSPGIARGMAVVHRQIAPIHKVIADDPSHEQKRLDIAIASFQEAMDKLVADASKHTEGEARDIIETFRLLAYDKGWVARIREAINTGLTAEASVRRVQNEISGRLAESSSKYLRERLRDIEEVSDRLVMHLTGEPHGKNRRSKLPAHFILVARTIGAAELLDYPPGAIQGVVLEEGPSTAHIVIIAKAMRIPVVGNIKQATQLIRAGDMVVVDSDHGEVFVRPSDDILGMVDEHLKEQEQRREDMVKDRDVPAVTKDGFRIKPMINAGLFMDLKEMKRVGAEGVGLYRTEIPYMVASQFPSVNEQIETYGRVIEESDGLPVTFRTFDIGGDKQLPYLRIPDESNPAMGWRATRIALDRPAILKRQLNALLRTSPGGHLRVMFPFITEIAEFDRTRMLLEKEKRVVAEAGFQLPKRTEVGTMLEIPSLTWQLPELLQRVDFLSIGTNDLLQFFFASDRGNSMVSRRYDPLSPAAMRMLRHILRQCKGADVPVCFCGEMAGSPIDMMALLAIGARELSMAPSSISTIKSVIRQLHLGQLEAFVLPLIDQGRPLRHVLTEFARDHQIRW